MSSQNDIQPHWHPDFRIKSTLPDMQAIHTNFIIKTVLFTCVFIAAGFVLYREYQAHLLRQTISQLEGQVQRVSAEDLSRLEKSEQFRKLAFNIQELQRFFKVPLIAHKGIVELASIKPEELTFTRLVLSESVVQVKSGKKSTSQVVFKLNISGDVQDLPVMTQFKRELEESLYLNPTGYKVDIEESVEQRNVDTGIIPFRLSVSLAPFKDAAKSKGVAE